MVDVLPDCTVNLPDHTTFIIYLQVQLYKGSRFLVLYDVIVLPHFECLVDR